MNTGELEQVHLAWQRLTSDDRPIDQFDRGIAAYQQGDYQAAIRQWRPLAESGDAKAQFELGLMYRYGLGVERDYAAALEWFKLAADQGNEGGQSNLGSMYQEGLGVPQNPVEAIKWFRLAAERGEAEAQSKLGAAYLAGRGTSRNYVEAFKWASIAAGQGAEGAVDDLDVLAAKMDPAQIEKAERRIQEWRPIGAAEPQAKLPAPKQRDEQVPVHRLQQLLAELGYDTGNIDGIAGRRTRAAVRAFRQREGLEASDKLTRDLIGLLENRVRARAAEAARMEAQFALPVRRKVTSLAQPVVAAPAAESAEIQIAAVPALPRQSAAGAQQQEADRYFRRGYSYAVGDGVARNDAEARRWFGKAAELGLPEAQYNLGVLSTRATGPGGGRDYYEAVRWWTQAAASGHAESQNALGVSYFKGLGAARDFAAAMQWFALAADQGYAEAQINLANMYENGQGTAANPVEAYRWFAIAAAGGLDKAIADRDRLARRLSAQQLRDVQRRVAEWIDKRS